MNKHRFSRFQHKALAFNLSGGDPVARLLLDTLPTNEVVVLTKEPNRDLLNRIREIAETPVGDLRKEVEENFGLTTEQFGTGEAWVDSQSLEEGFPEWLNTAHSGWYLDIAHLAEFYRNFLLQEVRVHIYTRYLEHKAHELDMESAALEMAGYGHYGFYL